MKQIKPSLLKRSRLKILLYILVLFSNWHTLPMQYVFTIAQQIAQTLTVQQAVAVLTSFITALTHDYSIKNGYQILNATNAQTITKIETLAAQKQAAHDKQTMAAHSTMAIPQSTLTTDEQPVCVTTTPHPSASIQQESIKLLVTENITTFIANIVEQINQSSQPINVLRLVQEQGTDNLIITVNQDKTGFIITDKSKTMFACIEFETLTDFQKTVINFNQLQSIGSTLLKLCPEIKAAFENAVCNTITNIINTNSSSPIIRTTAIFNLVYQCKMPLIDNTFGDITKIPDMVARGIPLVIPIEPYQSLLDKAVYDNLQGVCCRDGEITAHPFINIVQTTINKFIEKSELSHLIHHLQSAPQINGKHCRPFYPNLSDFKNLIKTNPVNQKVFSALAAGNNGDLATVEKIAQETKNQLIKEISQEFQARYAQETFDQHGIYKFAHQDPYYLTLTYQDKENFKCFPQDLQAFNNLVLQRYAIKNDIAQILKIDPNAPACAQRILYRLLDNDGKTIAGGMGPIIDCIAQLTNEAIGTRNEKTIFNVFFLPNGALRIFGDLDEAKICKPQTTPIDLEKLKQQNHLLHAINENKLSINDPAITNAAVQKLHQLAGHAQAETSAQIAQSTTKEHAINENVLTQINNETFAVENTSNINACIGGPKFPETEPMMCGTGKLNPGLKLPEQSKGCLSEYQPEIKTCGTSKNPISFSPLPEQSCLVGPKEHEQEKWQCTGGRIGLKLIEESLEKAQPKEPATTNEEKAEEITQETTDEQPTEIVVPEPVVTEEEINQTEPIIINDEVSILTIEEAVAQLEEIITIPEQTTAIAKAVLDEIVKQKNDGLSRCEAHGRVTRKGDHGFTIEELTGILLSPEELAQFIEKFDRIKIYEFDNLGKIIVFTDFQHILGPILIITCKENKFEIKGLHHDLLGKVAESKIIDIAVTTEEIRDDGFYEANCSYKGATKPSTFFPQHWTRVKVIEKIFEALENPIEQSSESDNSIKANAVQTKNGRWRIEGKISEGITIRIMLEFVQQEGDKKLMKIITAYPVLNQVKKD